MNVTGFTLSVPVSDLERSIAFYRRVLDLPEPELRIGENIVEFNLGRLWLQLAVHDASVPFGAHGAVFGVADVRAQVERLRADNVTVTDPMAYEDVVTWAEVTDPDGNVFTLVTEHPGAPGQQP